MACFEEFPPIALKEGYGAVERLNGKESSLDGEEMAAIVDEIHKLKMGKAAVGTGKAAAASGKVQMEKKRKKRKARHTADGTGKSAVATDKVQMEKTGKHRIPDEYVRLILALQREEPMEPEESPYLLPGCSVEEARRKHEEETALFKRIYDDFEPFQAMVRKEWYEKGYVEVDYDYVAGLAKVKDIHKEDWDEWRKHQESLEIEYAESDDEDHAGFYVPYNPEEVLEQFNLGEASQKMSALESN